MPQKWNTYEEVAIDLLNRFAKEFDVDCFETKQHVEGELTTWEIDGKGVCEGSEAFIVVECRRYTKSRQCQEAAGGIAFKIQDLGAKGGILVSPLGFQLGGQKIAAGTNIIDVRLNANATGQDYVLQFLGKVFAGVRQHLEFKQKPGWEIRRNDGTIERGE